MWSHAQPYRTGWSTSPRKLVPNTSAGDDRDRRDGTREQGHAGRHRRAVLPRVKREVGAEYAGERHTDPPGGIDDPRGAAPDPALR